MTITASEQATHNDLHGADRHCANMGGRCARTAQVDVHVTMTSGQAVALRLCTQHANRTLERGLKNATVTHVTAV